MVNKDLSPLSPNKKSYYMDSGDYNGEGNESGIRRLDSNVTHNTHNTDNN